MTKKDDALKLAMLFHTTYERLAPNFGYETRTDTKVFDPLSANGQLMLAVCSEIYCALLAQPVTAYEALAQPEQEPVESCNGMPAYEGPLSKTQRKQLTQELNAPLTLNGVALYPQSEWVGLTEEEVRGCYAHVEGVTVSEAVILMSVVRITQAMLKGKNS